MIIDCRSNRSVGGGSVGVDVDCRCRGFVVVSWFGVLWKVDP